MPLAQTVDSLDSIPEAARGAYVEKDGKFVLDFEVPDVEGLKRHNKTLSDEAAARRIEAAEYKKLGKTPAEIAEMVETARKKEEQAEIKAGNFDGVLAKKLGDQKLESDKLLDTANKQRQSALKIAEQAIVNTSLATALTKAKANEQGMKGAAKLFGDRVKIEFDENGNASSQILDADGKPMVGSMPNGLANYDDLVKEIVKEYPNFFEGSGSGSGKDSSQRRDAGGKTMSRAEFDKLTPPEQGGKIRAGFTVVD